MFEYFNTKTNDISTFVDIWKNTDLGNIKDTDDYIYHTIAENENLMSISYKYYNTINDWWILYIFNEIKDINFFNINNNTLERTTSYYLYLLNNYDVINVNEKAVIKNSIRKYYIFLGNTEKESILLTSNILLNVTLEFQNDFKQYLQNTILTESFFVTKMKIPSSTVVLNIKNQLEKLSITWINK